MRSFWKFVKTFQYGFSFYNCPKNFVDIVRVALLGGAQLIGLQPTKCQDARRVGLVDGLNIWNEYFTSITR